MSTFNSSSSSANLAPIQKSSELRANDGTFRGDRIPDSKYIRDFCAACKEPIRVTDIWTAHYCDDCNPTTVPVKPLLSDNAPVDEPTLAPEDVEELETDVEDADESSPIDAG